MSRGFFAMLRFHSYGKFSKENLTIALRGRKEVFTSKISASIIIRLLVSNCVVGFYFTFNDKFHPGARAYFCRVGDLHNRLRLICPLKQLVTILELTQDDIFSPELSLLGVF